MKKHLIILVVFIALSNLFAQDNNGWQVQVGPEVDFTEAKTLATDSIASKNINITSFCLSTGLMKNIFTDNIYIGGIYSFGRISYHNESTNVHKYSIVGSVIAGPATFSLLYEYIYTKLNKVDVNGSGLGVKIAFAPFKNQRLVFFASANQKNQALGLVYTF